ncbi:desmocollin-2-like [Saccoglossus kowalevskii]
MGAITFILSFLTLLLILQEAKTQQCDLTYPGTSYNVNENTAEDTIVVQGSSFTGGVYPAYEARIVSVSPGPADLFYVKPDTGELYIGSEPLDYEESPMHTVIIECWDTTDPATKDSVTVTVNVVNANDPPVFTNLPGTGSVNEDAGSSASVFQVNVQDQDTSNTITYAILNQNPGGTLKFTIDSSGLVKVISANSLQADPPSAVTLYTLLIRASDGSTFISDVLTINVLGTFDESPSFARSSYTGSVDEDGTAITWINPPAVEPKDDFNDADAGDSYTYSISGKYMGKTSNIQRSIQLPVFIRSTNTLVRPTFLPTYSIQIMNGPD